VPIRIDQAVRALDGWVLDTGVYDHVPHVNDARIIPHGHLPRGQLSARPVTRGVAARRTARRARRRDRERHRASHAYSMLDAD
jgi:hypothetical protein